MKATGNMYVYLFIYFWHVPMGLREWNVEKKKLSWRSFFYNSQDHENSLQFENEMKIGDEK